MSAPLRRVHVAVAGAALAFLLAGCATAPPLRTARTTVVLMPDEDGNVGMVSVSNASGSQQIDRAYSFATVDGVAGKPSGMTPMGQASMTAAYDQLIQAQPPKPKSFVLNFLLDRTVLTEESKAMIPAVLEAVRERKPTEITIFGHADATGSEKHNVKLSAERARTIANLLRKTDPTLDRIDVQYFGDKAPLVQGPDGRAEPRNRRAEIMVL